MAQTTIGVLHPGEMGSVVAACAREAGARVVWSSEGRRSATRERAAGAGLEDVGSLRDLVAASDVIVSVCPPESALDVARDVAAAGFARMYVDGNAVSPATAREVAGVIEGAGATFIDGGIIGPPPRKRGTTRLYVSGAGAPQIKALFGDSALEVIVLGGRPIQEPLAWYGPFVMNTKAEVMQAMDDYQAGRLGVIPAGALMPYGH